MATHLIVQNARIDGWPDGSELVDLDVVDGRIHTIAPSANLTAPSATVIDAAGGLLSTPFAEPHTHPDKVFSRERIRVVPGQPELTRDEKMQRQRDLKADFTREDVAERAERYLRECARSGIALIAGQADIDSVTELRSVEGVLEARDRHASWIDLVVTAFPQEGIVADKHAEDLLVEALKMGADRVGGWPNNEPSEEASLQHLRTVFALAERFDVPIDINIDYFTDPTEQMLEHLAELTIAHGMQGKVNANHVGALETYPDVDAQRVIEKVAAADISITVCPMNLAGTRPYRGVSRPLELLDAGVNLTIGIGNYEDNWEFIGVIDPLERARLAWHGLSLSELPSGGYDEAWSLVTSSAARAIGRPQTPIAVGSEANFVVLSAQDRVQALRNEAGNRWLVTKGQLRTQRLVEQTLNY